VNFIRVVELIVGSGDGETSRVLLLKRSGVPTFADNFPPLSLYTA
jgi:hypothetical protein